MTKRRLVKFVFGFFVIHRKVRWLQIYLASDIFSIGLYYFSLRNVAGLKKMSIDYRYIYQELEWNSILVPESIQRIPMDAFSRVLRLIQFNIVRFPTMYGLM